MKLSNNFTLSELTYTSTNLPNIPMKTELDSLILLTNKILQPLRDMYDKPIHINSGYRSPVVNKKVGGVATSQHIKGEAADITGGSKEQNKILFELIKKYLIKNPNGYDCHSSTGVAYPLIVSSANE